MRQCLCHFLCHFLCLWLWLAVEVSGEHHLRGKHHRGGPRRANGTHHEHALNYVQSEAVLFDPDSYLLVRRHVLNSHHVSSYVLRW